MGAIVNKDGKIAKRLCAFEKCKVSFVMKTKNQQYCRPAHKVAAFNLRKFRQAVEAEVERRLREQQHIGPGQA